jgi:HAD superfamily hydrolase (TIGR01509 family)
MKFEGLIFDFGFTLFEFKDASVKNYLKSYKKGLDKSIVKLKEYKVIENKDTEKLFVNTFIRERNSNFKNSIKTKREFPTHIIFHSIIEKLGLRKLDHERYQELADLYHSHEEQQWIPLENTKKTLEILSNHKNLKMAVLSNHPNHKTIENLLMKYDLYHFFDIVVTSAKFGMRKPDPRIFLYTIKQMGLKDPSLCLIIGDEYADIIGGHRAGLKTILYKRMIRFPFEKEIKINDYIEISDISEILNHI